MTAALRARVRARLVEGADMPGGDVRVTGPGREARAAARRGDATVLGPHGGSASTPAPATAPLPAPPLSVSSPLPALSPVPPLPAGFHVQCDPETTVLSRGKVLLGGSPLRLLTLSVTGGGVWEALLAGRPVGEAGPGAGTLARRLVEAGLAHPVPPAPSPGRAADVTAVIPVRDHARGLGRLIAALAGRCAEVIVVDDGSTDGTGEAAAAAGARVLRHDRPLGPAAARLAGAAAATTPLILFCDADVLPPAPGAPLDGGRGLTGTAAARRDVATSEVTRLDVAGTDMTRPDGATPVDWFGLLLGHLADPAVGAVAPRVASPVPSGARAGLLARYESARSPLDLGSRPAGVRPGSRVSYAPSAALLIRRELAGFDPAMRYGEDVDLIWRIVGAGWSVRYEPAAVVHHRPRADWAGWARQRFGYGSSAGPLAARHPGPLRPAGQAAAVAAAALAIAAAPASSPAWSRPWARPGIAAKRALSSGGAPPPRRWVPRRREVAGAAGAVTAVRSVVTAVRLARRLAAAPRPTRLAWVMVIAGRRYALEAAADNVRRGWWPALAWSRPGRLVVALSAAAPAARDWWVTRPDVGLLPYALLRFADDTAYSLGVWWGCARARTARPLLPSGRLPAGGRRGGRPAARG
ncbi:glycosyltransferase [Pseudofrankia sp. BMG5.37]|uniref:glycosyltransferase n=1 Tax=Pseudofrankia sp. BMG5.37 TaxID=3050035 RepID=UPI0028941CCE|nr:glycosyltransferase [Pseudofrankia sp. BMG5.37]MDT3446257.1 glycosyltransferase [Pseudofrankia sp. BMG5.37]